MRIKTNVSALVAGTILSAVLTLITTGDGSPPNREELARQDQRQVIQPLPRSPELNGAQPSPSSAPSAELPAVKVDAYVVQGLRGAVVYIALFLAMHLGMRRSGISHRWAYAGAGSLAALVAIGGATPGAGWGLMLERGNLSFFLLVTAVSGAVLGFLYNWRAGTERDGDDPARLQEALNQQRANGPPLDPTEDLVLIDTGTAEYFSGPVQVRTSLPIAFVAALLSAGCVGLVSILVGGLAALMIGLQESTGQTLQQQMFWALHSQIGTLAFVGMAFLPITVMVLISHMIARARGKTSQLAYLGIGAASTPVVGLLAGPMGVIVGLGAAVPVAVAMVMYRNMAGLEPKAVKEDILLNDRRNLVPENHARRKFGRLIKG